MLVNKNNSKMTRKEYESKKALKAVFATSNIVFVSSSASKIRAVGQLQQKRSLFKQQNLSYLSSVRLMNTCKFQLYFCSALLLFCQFLTSRIIQNNKLK